MKKHFYAMAIGLFTVCIANAQIKKGDVLLGGNVNFNKQDVKPDGYGTDQTSFSIYPSIAKAIKDDLLVGINLSYSRYRSKNGGPVVKTDQDNYGLGVFVRKYRKLGANFSLFAEGDLSGTYARTNSYQDGGPKPPANKSYNINAGFYPGIAYFLSRHVQLETGIQNLAYAQYGHTRSGEGSTETTSNGFSLGTNLSQAFDNFVVGVKWLL